jgi:ABC-type branched-subunit amino acid transport system ATPase component
MSIWGNRAVLEVTDLHAGYGRIPILNGISLSLEAGEVVGVLGHNGMGKTTLLRTLSGQIRNNSGSIIFDGIEISRQSAYRRARSGLGYVPQGRDIFPQLSVLENLKIAELGRKGGSAIPEVLGYFPILEKLLERPGQALGRRATNSCLGALSRRQAETDSFGRTDGGDSTFHH